MYVKSKREKTLNNLTFFACVDRSEKWKFNTKPKVINAIAIKRFTSCVYVKLKPSCLQMPNKEPRTGQNDEKGLPVSFQKHLPCR